MPAFNLANLAVNITGNPGPLNRTLTNVQRTLLGFGRYGNTSGSLFVRAFGRSMGGMATIGFQAGEQLGIAVGLGLGSAIEKAASFTEIINRLQVAVGKSADLVIAKSEAMAKQFNVSKIAYVSAAASFAQIGKNIGLADDKAAKLGVDLTQIGLDATSLYDNDFDVALEKIKAGLTGASRPLRSWGIDLEIGSVKAKAAAMGLGAVGRELTLNEKILARSALITRGLTSAQGDMAATFGTVKNQARALTGGIENLMLAIGEKLTPAYREFLVLANEVVADLSTGWENNKGVFAEWSQALIAGIKEIGYLYRNWGDNVERVGLNLDEFMTNVGTGIDNVVSVFTWMGTVIGETMYSIGSVITGTFRAAFAYVVNAAPVIGEAIKAAIMDPLGRGGGVDKALAKLPAFVMPKVAGPLIPDFPKMKAFGDELVDKKRWALERRIDAREEEHDKKVAKDKPGKRERKVPEPLDEIEGGKKKHAAFFGAAEFAKHLQIGAFGGTEAELKKANRFLKIIAEKPEKGKGGIPFAIAAP